MHRSELRINKISFFEGLYFTEEEAEEFVSKRTYYKYGNENIDREVYLKIYYYNDINLKPDPNSKYDKSLIGFPICVSVFQDKNYMYHIADFWNPEVTDYDKKYIMENGEWPNNKYKSNGVAALDSSIGYIDDDEENESSNEENISEINELSDLKIYFMPNKATLTTESIQKLDNIAMILHEISWNRLHIYGYSDKYEYNSNTEFDKELAEARSKMVMNYLVSKGINSSKLISIYSGYNKMNINGEIKDTERVVEFILKE
jgi:outer membrane protein OmpA-like peptidoglycan-associated protein